MSTYQILFDSDVAFENYRAKVMKKNFNVEATLRSNISKSIKARVFISYIRMISQDYSTIPRSGCQSIDSGAFQSFPKGKPTWKNRENQFFHQNWSKHWGDEMILVVIIVLVNTNKTKKIWPQSDHPLARYTYR